MDLADGKLAYQQTKPFITTRGVKPLTHPKEVFSVFFNHHRLNRFQAPIKPYQTFEWVKNGF